MTSPLLGKTYCKIVKVSTRVDATGNEKWVLTHVCGKVEERIRRKRNQRHQHKAPNRVLCDGNKDGTP